MVLILSLQLRSETVRSKKPRLAVTRNADPKPLDFVPDSEPGAMELRPHREGAPAEAASATKALGRALEDEIRNAAKNGQMPPVRKSPLISSSYTVAKTMVLNAYTPWDSILHNTGLVPQSNIGPTLLSHITTDYT